MTVATTAIAQSVLVLCGTLTSISFPCGAIKSGFVNRFLARVHIEDRFRLGAHIPRLDWP
jgi:hypothetical protein